MIAGCQLALLSTASKYNWNAVPAYTVEPARIHERGTVPDRKLAIITILRPPIDPILKLTPQNPHVFRHPADCLNRMTKNTHFSLPSLFRTPGAAARRT